MALDVGKSKETLPIELPGQWIDLSGKRIITRAGHGETTNIAKEYVIPARHADSVKLTGKYAYYEGTMIVGAPDGSMQATPYSALKEIGLKNAGYRLAAATTIVPSLLIRQKFEDEETQRRFEAL